MRTGSLDKTPARTRNAKAESAALQDELIQELVERKTSLQNLRLPEGRAATEGTITLRQCVSETLETFFTRLDGEPAAEVYQMVLAEVEAPMLEVVMRHTQENQCRTAEILGMSRGTLRKKLHQYGML